MTQPLPDRPPAGQAIGPEIVARVSKLANEMAGIILDGRNASFIVTRLTPRLRALNLRKFTDYCAIVENRANKEERRHFLAAVTTNTTSFFRESAHYDWLHREGFAFLLEQGAGRLQPLTMWSAACSSGQELYSGLMLAKDHFERERNLVQIRGVGTDISPAMVRRAALGVYDRPEVESLPIAYRRKYMLSSKSGDGRARVAPDLRKLTEWREANLMDPGSLGNFRADIVFLRNVLIYFSDSDQRKILKAILARLAPHGILMTGHAEAGAVRDLGMVTLLPAIFRREI